MTFGSEFARHTATPTKDYKRVIFFDKKHPSMKDTNYSELNGVIIPTPDMIHSFQLNKIENLQEEALNTRMKQNADLNALFTSGDPNAIPGIYLNDEEVKLDEAITRIVNQISSIGLSARRKPKEHNADKVYKQWGTKFKNLYDMLSSLQQQLNITSVTYQSYLDSIKQAMAACELKDLGVNTLIEWAKTVNQLKGDTVEALGTAWLNKLQIPNIQTITLGNVALRGEVSPGRRTGQLIMDMMALNISEIDITNTPITYELADGTKVSTTLEKFFKALDSASTAKEDRIYLDDEAYDMLLNLSALNIQAKSGKTQLPWNVALQSKVASTSVSIGEFDPAVASGIGIVRAFQLLHTLNLDEDLDIVDKSADYNALANYGLATMLIKVLHLSGKEGNQMLLTPSGFITYPERIKELFKDGNDYIKFVEDITLGENTLSIPYHVTLASKPRGY